MANFVWNRQGTLSVNNGSKSVTGTLTLFQLSKPGDAIMLAGQLVEIDTIETNTALTLKENWAGSNQSGASFAIIPVSPRWQLTGDLAIDTRNLLATVALFNAPVVEVDSATTCDIGAATSGVVRITGSTGPITSLGTTPNRVRYVIFASTPTLTHHGTSLILPGAANITAAAGDTAVFASDASGNWRCLAYMRAGSSPINPTFGAITLSGGQIAFPATQNPSSNANTLDDYEEGTWTPTLTFVTAGDLSVTYTLQSGTYTKIGKVVTYGYVLVASVFTHASASGLFFISGLPFPTAGNFQGSGALVMEGYTKANFTTLIHETGTVGQSRLYVLACGSGQSRAELAVADVPSGSGKALYGSGTYIATG